MKTHEQSNIFRSEVAAAVHEMIEGGHKAGPIDDGAKRRFDEPCLVPAVAVVVDQTAEIEMASDHSAEDGTL
jgi:putative transcriptional regulator